MPCVLDTLTRNSTISLKLKLVYVTPEQALTALYLTKDLSLLHVFVLIDIII